MEFRPGSSRERASRARRLLMALSPMYSVSLGKRVLRGSGRWKHDSSWFRLTHSGVGCRSVFQEVAERRFDVWICLRQTPNLPDLQRALFRQLTGGEELSLPAEREGRTEKDAALKALRTVAKGQRVLVILDDIWSPEQEKYRKQNVRQAVLASVHAGFPACTQPYSLACTCVWG